MIRARMRSRIVRGVRSSFVSDALRVCANFHRIWSWKMTDLQQIRCDKKDGQHQIAQCCGGSTRWTTTAATQEQTTRANHAAANRRRCRARRCANSQRTRRRYCSSSPNEEPQVVPVARLSVTKIHFNPRIRESFAFSHVSR